MKKLVPGLFGAMLIASPLHAQASFGVLGGFVSSSVTLSNGDASITPSSRSGFAVGISATGNVAPNVAVGPDVMYIQKGFKLSDNDGNSATGKLAYVEVPVLVHVKFGTGPTRFFVLGGPSIAFKASCSEQVTVSGEGSASEACDGPDVDVGVKSTDFSLMFGAGLEFGQVSVSARYDLGLTNINQTSGDDTTAKNHALLILAGFRLGH